MQDSGQVTQKLSFALFFTLIPLKMADLAQKSLKHFSRFFKDFYSVISKGKT